MKEKGVSPFIFALFGMMFYGIIKIIQSIPDRLLPQIIAFLLAGIGGIIFQMLIVFCYHEIKAYKKSIKRKGLQTS